jgi:hypothetical protein
MKNLIVENKWEYEIHDTTTTGGYGYCLMIYKNNKIVYNQAGFGSITGAKWQARDYFLAQEFGIDREY